nr:hypothetical protein GCM10020092_016520 [Actinoplanes digitatis]
MSPTARELAPDRARAALFGLKPISSAMATMRRRVASETPGWPLSAYDTAPLDTPARRAMSAIVGRFTRVPLSAKNPSSGTSRRRETVALQKGCQNGRWWSALTLPRAALGLASTDDLIG